ncbi:MAG: cupin domain-containing protein [Candidatus Eisenbacteria bacterium]|uniref:Cupin domain-containing protein n=1 Tax=Eiseniibacteriota bacterium TaxID=2212470 RepID=A0A948W531_UNCEI|nr:cupin domain-containing protein [Candidatus Eisenbacteria bacterium]MBU1950891.1 cupin domain-containing protein [Candidatus Eisenbacteria bacterium]MBU2692857.1 cupin domain-containing protein [Candidatus Eisenbacteria bacterium]
MIARKYQDVPAQPVEGTPGAAIRWLIAQKDGAPNFAMRIIEIQEGSASPHHTHPSEHEVFILEGNGVVRSEEGDKPIAPGIFVFVPPEEKHQFVNTGSGLLRFICIVPLEK